MSFGRAPLFGNVENGVPLLQSTEQSFEIIAWKAVYPSQLWRRKAGFCPVFLSHFDEAAKQEKWRNAFGCGIMKTSLREVFRL